MTSEKRLNSYEMFYNRARKKWPFNTGDLMCRFDCIYNLQKLTNIYVVIAWRWVVISHVKYQILFRREILVFHSTLYNKYIFQFTKSYFILDIVKICWVNILYLTLWKSAELTFYTCLLFDFFYIATIELKYC